MERFIKTRLKVSGTREQSRSLLGTHTGYLEDMIAQERAFYSWQENIQAVESTIDTVVAVFGDGTIQITTFTLRVTKNA